MSTKKNLTICFYEYPAALHEISAWEKLKKDSIIDKSELPEGRIKFLLLNSKKEYELLICIPNYINAIKHSKDIFEQKIKERFIYNKTLFFGKFNSRQIIEVTKLIKEFEK